MSNEKIKPLITTNQSLSPKLRWMNNSRIRIEFKGSCVKQNKMTFTQRNVVSLFNVYKLDRWLQDLNVNFALKGCSLGGDRWYYNNSRTWIFC